MKLTKEQRRVLREVGKAAYRNMVKKVGGKEALNEIRRAQGEHGIEGGAPPKYPPCSLRLNNKKLRHRFYGGVCKCGIVNLPNFYRFEGVGEDRVWYQREGKGWKRI